MKRIGYKHTVAASFTAFVVQAVVNNFAPLLFLTFQAQYGIELSKITVLITANFFIQIFVDLTAVLFVDRIGYRASTVLAHAMCATGLIFMTILPEILPSAFAGLLISVFCYAVGAGLLDITINPIVNSCPSTNFQSAALPAPFVLLLGQRRGSRYIDPVLRTVFDGELEDNVADMGNSPDSQRCYVHPRAYSARRRRG